MKQLVTLHPVRREQRMLVLRELSLSPPIPFKRSWFWPHLPPLRFLGVKFRSLGLLARVFTDSHCTGRLGPIAPKMLRSTFRVALPTSINIILHKHVQMKNNLFQMCLKFVSEEIPDPVKLTLTTISYVSGTNFLCKLPFYHCDQNTWHKQLQDFDSMFQRA